MEQNREEHMEEDGRTQGRMWEIDSECKSYERKNISSNAGCRCHTPFVKPHSLQISSTPFANGETPYMNRVPFINRAHYS